MYQIPSLASTVAGQGGSEERILLALRDLLAEKPYSEISVTDLCKQSGLSRNTFYKFFENKDAVIDYLWEWMMLDYHEQRKKLASGASYSLEVLCLHYFRYWYSVRDWVKLLVDNGFWRSEFIFSQRSAALLMSRDWEPPIDQDEEARWLAIDFANAGCAQMILKWCHTGFRKSPQEMADIAVHVLSGQLAKTKVQR